MYKVFDLNKDEGYLGKSDNIVLGMSAANEDGNWEISVNRLGSVYEYYYDEDKGTVSRRTLFDGRRNKFYQKTVRIHGKSLNMYRIIALSHLGNADAMDKDTYNKLCDAIFDTKIYSTTTMYERSRFDAHHIDGNHNNNRRNNLVLVTTGDHRHLHDFIKKCGLAMISGNEKDAKYYKRVYNELIKKARSIDYILGEVQLF